MARLARNLNATAGGLFHVRGLVAGHIGDYPLQEPENALQLIFLIHHFCSLYFCSVAALNVLGNHYHLVVRFQAYRKLSRRRLLEIAQRFYPNPRYRPYSCWNDRQWELFNRRLFNLSELMRNIQSAYARWYNEHYNRKGRFWADRFQLTTSSNLIETVFYVELNALRAHLVKWPEQWRFSSAWMRRHARDDWLMPIEELMGGGSPEECERLFWCRLYWRGTQASKENDGLIPVELAEQMEREGFARGCYREAIAPFTRGVLVSNEDEVQRTLDEYRQRGIYTSDREPVPLGVGNLYAVRGPRSNFVQT